ncbi:pyridoxamine 5'-phosphate oxidase family protein [Halostella sp. JP-L12]|uniref:pyridoxamine 5'-phosphate oxidase family protein n=1 Tax=Halostella TaxID=1843185 RepID=UPI000EF7A6CE|nr:MULTISPECIES: pyridoxamine 5'-phosphate oxidase family protein [Halostella]NHN49388.1 pyridoxamine 5'-phosphate oxidase family protein [Halostella sp. JP-L12]
MTIEHLSEYGLREMGDEEIERFLRNQSQGVLGLSTEDAPYLVPMSYGYDGGSHLYFFYVVGEESRKAALSARSQPASFLVYNAEMFHWRSVSVTGTIEILSEEERSELTDAQMPIWRPGVIETANEREGNEFYRFRIEESTGIKHDMQSPSYPFHQQSSSDQ